MRWLSRLKLKNPITRKIRTQYFKLIRHKKFKLAVMFENSFILLFLTPAAIYGAHIKAASISANTELVFLVYAASLFIPLNFLVNCYYGYKRLKTRFERY